MMKNSSLLGVKLRGGYDYKEVKEVLGGIIKQFSVLIVVVVVIQVW